MNLDQRAVGSERSENGRGAGPLKKWYAEDLIFKLKLTATGALLFLHCQIDRPDPSRRAGRVSSPQCLRSGERWETAILSAQHDFRSTRYRLQEIVEDSGHTFLLYPRFYSELNWIE